MRRGGGLSAGAWARSGLSGFIPTGRAARDFFAAVVRKGFRCGRPLPHRRRRGARSSLPVDRAVAAELRRWVNSPERMCFVTVADTCYGYYVAQAEAVKALAEALPVIYSGVAMGQLFKGRLRPDPALAFFCGLNRDAVPAAELDEEQTLRFLRRQEIGAGPFAEGINLVCARGPCARIREAHRKPGKQHVSQFIANY